MAHAATIAHLQQKKTTLFSISFCIALLNFLKEAIWSLTTIQIMNYVSCKSNVDCLNCMDFMAWMLNAIQSVVET